MNKSTGEPVLRKNGSRSGNSTRQRTSSRRSEARHGQTYEESETAIRAVTPDSASSANADITALPSPSAFPQNATRLQFQEPSTSVSNTDEESTTDSRRRKTNKKLRRDHYNQSDTSPNSFFEKTRKRLNSITTAPSNTPRQDDTSVSIGFPSVVQTSVFPELQDVRQQLPRTPRRTVSAEDGGTGNINSVRSPLMIESDADKVLKLMKTLNGRMHGILFYRPIGTTAWYSGYCAINVAPGSLVCQTKGDVSKTETLIPDLRGCSVRTHYDTTEQNAHLTVVLPISGLGYQLRPPVPETFESWLAALLCWQPLKPKGIHNKMTKPPGISASDRATAGSRRLSDMTGPKSTAVVKSSQMMLWDGPLPAGSYRRQAKRPRLGSPDQYSWRRINCTLHENGTLRLLAEETATTLRSLKLGSLARCAIQRLDESVLNAAHCIAIHPQYTVSPTKADPSPALVLSLSTRVAFEAWFVLLQAMATPELYGPEMNTSTTNRPRSSDDSQPTSRNMFRIERSLRVKIIEVRFPEYAVGPDPLYRHNSPLASRAASTNGAEIYVDVMLGRDLRARTIAKPFASSIFWVEEFCLADIPSMLSSVSVVLKVGNPDEKEWTMIMKGNYEVSDGEVAPNFESIEVASHDPLFGKVDVPLNDLERDRFVERWWSVLDGSGIDIGQALIKMSLVENLVLMESEYRELSALLHNFDNSLTSQIAQAMGSDLRSLSDVLLDVFQASDRVEDWINNLVEEEIDGIYREQPPVRMRFSGRIHSNDSYESAEQRELLVRDLSRSATMEANLLFRGNSLITKALDAHMRRIGKDYLEKTLGEKLRGIVISDPNCEVDPNKVKSPDQLEKNWSNLIGLTSSIWQAIAASVDKCPASMRNVLKHIRSCAEDRYGSFIRTVKYTSVSGFLFLRFFCPAILNPKLFGLLEDHPMERPRRTFTLIAKSLIVLANVTKFGQKEPWMEPMNRFLTAATPEFKKFIEQICSWSAPDERQHEPQYQAAAQVRARLPTLSREGLPSLPFLLDAPRSLATLVDMWAENAPANIHELEADQCVQDFNRICLNLKQRTSDCMASAEVAQEPNSRLDERRWQKMLSEQPRNRFAHDVVEEGGGDSEITALPQPTDTRRYSSHYSNTGGSGHDSPSIDERGKRYSSNSNTRTTMTKATDTKGVPAREYEDGDTQLVGRRRDGTAKNKVLEKSGSRRGCIDLSVTQQSKRT